MVALANATESNWFHFYRIRESFIKGKRGPCEESLEIKTNKEKMEKKYGE